MGSKGHCEVCVRRTRWERCSQGPKATFPGPPGPSTPPPPTKPLCDLLTVTAGKVEPHPGSCHQPSLYGSKDRLGHQAPAAGLAGGSALPGRPQRRKAVPQGFRRPDGPGSQRSWVGDHNLVYVLLGLHGDALTRWMKEVRCRAWITNSLRVGVEELKTESGICRILGSDGQVRRQRTS